MFKRLLVAVVSVNMALFAWTQNYSMFGHHNKPSPIYKAGEEMVFTVKLLDDDKPVAGKILKWVRTGDDGKSVSGEGLSTKVKCYDMKIACAGNMPVSGYQSLCAAGLDKDVTSCYAWSPWCCDFGRTEKGRIVGGWYIKYSPALNYFDPVNLVKHANPKCNLFIISNLGDYVCPPSGVWIAYNNFAGPKKMEIRQGCEHGFSMKKYPTFTISSDNSE
ncbi:MAG: acetylxylan esterase [Kiritimatiellae bacterium]|jgi:hypothetical protein|nr:acetylxylan esterase [Kiritimatiellia bacterium]